MSTETSRDVWKKNEMRRNSEVASEGLQINVTGDEGSGNESEDGETSEVGMTSLKKKGCCAIWFLSL